MAAIVIDTILLPQRLQVLLERFANFIKKLDGPLFATACVLPVEGAPLELAILRVPPRATEHAPPSAMCEILPLLFDLPIAEAETWPLEARTGSTMCRSASEFSFLLKAGDEIEEL